MSRRSGKSAARLGTEHLGDRWATVLFLALAVVVSLAFYRSFVFHPGRMLLGSDMVGEGFPLRRFAMEEIRAGRGLPLWNPFLYGGLPFVATLPGPLFYPTTVLYLLLPLYRAIGWTFVIHTFLAGAFAYFAGRAFGLRRSAASVCGLAFMLSGYLMSTLYGGHDGRMFGIVLIPLVFGMAERGFRDGSKGWHWGVALAVGLQILTPHTQIMYFSTLALLLFGVYRLLGRYRAGGELGRGVGRAALQFGGALTLAAALGAVQLLPTYALLGHVGRAAQQAGYDFASSWALPPQELSALFLPDLIGSLGSYWGANPFKLHTEYLGVVPFALALVAIVGSFSKGVTKEHRRTIWFLGGASVMAILFALGAATPVHKIAYAVVPLIRSFRAPAMMLGPAAFFLALLAGFGWERILQSERSTLGPVLWLVVAPFLLLSLAAAVAPDSLLDFAYQSWFPAGWTRQPPAGLAHTLRVTGWIALASWAVVLGAAWVSHRSRLGRWWVITLLALMLVDLWRVDARYLQTAPFAETFPKDHITELLQERLDPGERAWPLERTYGNNELMYYSIPTVSGSQKFLFPWYRRLVGGLGYENLFRDPVLWQLFDVRFLSTRSDPKSPLLRPVGEGVRGRLFEVTLPASHAYFPAHVSATADTAEALRRTLALQDPEAEVVVETSSPPAAGAGTARMTKWTPDELRLTATVERQGLLVLSEVWAPGWHAYVDDTEVEVLRADVAFRAVVVPQGEHRIRFVYTSRAFRWGSRVSFVALLLVLGGGLASLRGWWFGRKAAGKAGEERRTG